MNSEQLERLYSVKEAAKLFRCTPNSIYSMIRTQRINTYRTGKEHYVKKGEIELYLKRRYKRDSQMKDGEYLFNPEKGRTSLTATAKQLNLKYCTLWHAMQRGLLKFEKVGSTYIVNQSDIEDFKKVYKKRAWTRKIE